MIILSSTTHTLTLLTSAAVNTDYVITWADITTSAFTPGESDGQISTATTTTIVSAPAASTQRQIKRISILNRSTTATQNITLKFNISGTERFLSPTIPLGPGERYEYLDDMGWTLYGPLGQKLEKTSEVATPRSAYSVLEPRPGTALRQTFTAGYNGWALLNTTAASPFGTFVNGTHGLAGSAITGGVARTGTFQVPNATTAHLLNSLDFGFVNGATPNFASVLILDMLWINSGLTVTTTTAQTLTPAAAAARDVNGTANGDGVMAGIWVTTATTNAGVITNMTISYTNQAGTAGRTGTMANFPSTASLDNVFFFQLQAGDRGVKSIESVTLGTSLVTGAVSMFLARPIACRLDTSRQLASSSFRSDAKEWLYNPGLPIPNDAALIAAYCKGSTTTANAVVSQLQIMDY